MGELSDHPRVQEMLRSTINTFFKSFGERLFEPHTVSELLWGYEEKALKALNALLAKLPFGKSFQVDEYVGMFTGVSL